MKSVIIIGGGIIGLSSAYYLQKEGCEVTIIDASDMTGLQGGASYVNAGYVTPSHIISLASPGMINKGIKWMFNSSSPFYMKPRLDMDFIRWAWYFKKSSTAAKVNKAVGVIKDINLLSKDLYQDLFDSNDLGEFQLDNRGILMLHYSDKAGEAEDKVAQMARNEGLDVTAMSPDELKKLEPNLSDSVRCGIHYTCDAHTTPPEIMAKMKAHLKKVGVIIKPNEQVEDFMIVNGKIEEVRTEQGNYSADEVILAAGSWTGIMSKKMGLKIPLQGGKGYKIDVARPLGINYPSILMEAKVAVTPMSGFTRFAGTMEFSGQNHFVRKERVAAIANEAKKYYNGLSFEKIELENAQCGIRPVSPDGLPYIGRIEGIQNLTTATGHAMMGWSLGPATGKLVTELICNQTLSMDISPFNPQRKF